jgi:hypothetical protein
MTVWVSHTLRQAAWAPLLVFVFYAVAAKGFNAYIHFPWLDMPTHFCGGWAMTYFYAVAVDRSQDRIGRIPAVVQSVLPLGLTAITAVVWEFLEFFSDIAVGTKMNLGVADTLFDLFFGLLGSAAAIAIRPPLTRAKVRAT